MSENIDQCTIEDYQQGLKDRIHESRLQIGSFYVAVFALRSQPATAIRFNANLVSHSRDDQTNLVEFVPVDEDFQPNGITCRSAMLGGVMNFLGAVRKPKVEFVDGSRSIMDTGYFIDFDQSDGGITDDEIAQMLEAELVPVLRRPLAQPGHQQSQ